MTQNTAWTSGELLAEAEGSLGSYMRSAVTDYYRGRDLDTAQAIRRAPNDTEAAELITAMRRGRWQDLLLIAGVAAAGVGMGAALQRLLGDPRLAGVSPVAVLGLVSMLAGFAAPVGVPGRAALVAGGATYAAGAQLFGWSRKGEP